MSSGRFTHLAAALALATATLMVAAPAAAGPRKKVCAVEFHSPDELRTIKAHLDDAQFEFVDMRPQLPDPGATTGPETPTPWIQTACTQATDCDIVVLSAEFAGRFFGDYGFSLSLQEMEEAACTQRCAGLFHNPQEVFLLACNTLATKAEDTRTPDEYLRVLLDHGFDRAAAERVVELRYGPLGPSFRESLRRIFQGVPRIYGFSSVAPLGVYTSPMLARYFQGRGDYAGYLTRASYDTKRNDALIGAFKGTSITQTSGLQPGDPATADRDKICALYDQTRPVRDRLQIAAGLLAREDALSFVPTMEVFLSRNPPSGYEGEERETFASMQNAAATRTKVLDLTRELNTSVLKLELAHFAVMMEWMPRDQFRGMAVGGAKQLLTQPLTSEVVDIMCEIGKLERLGDQFTAADIAGRLYSVPEGLRLIDCIDPEDPAVTKRIFDSLDHHDPVVRSWAVFVLSHRLPLDEATLQDLLRYVNDPQPDVAVRVQWIFRAQGRLPKDLLKAMQQQHPQFGAELQAVARRGR